MTRASSPPPSGRVARIRAWTTYHLPAPLYTASLTALLANKKPDIVHVQYWGLTDDPWYKAAIHAPR